MNDRSRFYDYDFATDEMHPVPRVLILTGSYAEAVAAAERLVVHHGANPRVALVLALGYQILKDPSLPALEQRLRRSTIPTFVCPLSHLDREVSTSSEQERWYDHPMVKALLVLTALLGWPPAVVSAVLAWLAYRAM